ncbi:hypothetical protein Tco_1525546 [Tanacetum coccineum]
MDIENTNPMLLQNLPFSSKCEYELWRTQIENTFKFKIMLYECHRDGNSFYSIARITTNADGTSTSMIPGAVTTKEKTQKKNDVKARSMLLMALPNEHLLTFNQYKDAKTLFDAIQTRFGGNDAIKKTQRTLLKQIQLAILGENISQEDLNLKFLRSLPSEWNTHVVVWRNKPDLDSMSFDDLYNNFKIVEQEVKRTATSSTSLSSQNMAFVSSPSKINKVNTANIQVSTANSTVSIDNTLDSTTNLSDATVYAFLSNQPNGSQLVHKDLEQIHEDDLEEMDLKWQLALLSLFAPPTIDLSNSGLEEFQQPKFKGYRPKASKSVYVDTSNKVKKTPDTPLVEELVLEKEKQIVFPTKIEFVKQQDKTARKPVKTVNTALSKSIVFSSKPMSRFSKLAQSTVKRPYQSKTVLTNKIFSQKVNTAKAQAVNIARLKAVNTARPNSAVVILLGLIRKMLDKQIEYVMLNASPLKYCLRGGYLCQYAVKHGWKDIMERAATTASSLEAEQDSGNINRTQSMATLNEPSP